MDIPPYYTADEEDENIDEFDVDIHRAILAAAGSLPCMQLSMEEYCELWRPWAEVAHPKSFGM